MMPSSSNTREKIRVAYIDDQLLFREALVAVLEETGSIAVVHNNQHGGLDVRTLLDSPISAILVALDGQNKDPMATVREARHVVPELPMCALVAVDRLDRAREALAAGCKGAVSTAATLPMLISALENLSRGQAFVDPTLGGRLLAKSVTRPTPKIYKNGPVETSPQDGSEVSRN